jgi:hypothetical protein
MQKKGIYVQIKKAFTEQKWVRLVISAFGSFAAEFPVFIFDFHVSFHPFKLPAKCRPWRLKSPVCFNYTLKGSKFPRANP